MAPYPPSVWEYNACLARHLDYESDATYGLLLDMNKGTLSFYHNGNFQGVAFDGLKDTGPLYPAAEAGTQKRRRMLFDFEAAMPDREEENDSHASMAVRLNSVPSDFGDSTCITERSIEVPCQIYLWRDPRRHVHVTNRETERPPSV